MKFNSVMGSILTLGSKNLNVTTKVSRKKDAWCHPQHRFIARSQWRFRVTIAIRRSLTLFFVLFSFLWVVCIFKRVLHSIFTFKQLPNRRLSSNEQRTCSLEKGKNVGLFALRRRNSAFQENYNSIGWNCSYWEHRHSHINIGRGIVQILVKICILCSLQQLNGSH